LLAHHDALRLRFEPGAAGVESIHAGMNEEVPFVRIDLSALPPAEQRAAIEEQVAALQAGLDLTAGPLLRVAHFDLGVGRPGRLLITVHHLVIDGVSWRILLEDLLSIYGQIENGEAVRLPRKTTSFQHWARRLDEYAQSQQARAELDQWLDLSGDARGCALDGRGAVHMPVDFPGGENSEASARSVKVALTHEETRALLQEVPGVYGTEINDALLTALGQALGRWTGSGVALVELEGHGREELFEDVDLTRTVGWFTTTYPVRLDLSGRPAAGGAAGDAEPTAHPGEALKAVKEQLRRVPRRGIGYGVLRYLCRDTALVAPLRAVPPPEISFNYLGQVDQTLADSSWKIAPERVGASRSPRGRRAQLLEIDGSIAGGRLQMEWSYSENLHRRATIEGVAQEFLDALRALIAHCQSPEAGGYTPSDFPDVALSQTELDALLGEISAA
jgi:non-ribosomal peptide synthase protein (TIGR01720 family)